MDFPSTPYFHYFEPAMAHSHFSTSHTAHGFASSLFPGSFRLIYFLKAHLLVLWAYNPLFLSFGLNGFSIHLLTLFCPCCWASSFNWASKNDHQHKSSHLILETIRLLTLLSPKIRLLTLQIQHKQLYQSIHLVLLNHSISLFFLLFFSPLFFILPLFDTFFFFILFMYVLTVTLCPTLSLPYLLFFFLTLLIPHLDVTLFPYTYLFFFLLFISPSSFL